MLSHHSLGLLAIRATHTQEYIAVATLLYIDSCVCLAFKMCRFLTLMLIATVWFAIGCQRICNQHNDTMQSITTTTTTHIYTHTHWRQQKHDEKCKRRNNKLINWLRRRRAGGCPVAACSVSGPNRTSQATVAPFSQCFCHVFTQARARSLSISQAPIDIGRYWCLLASRLCWICLNGHCILIRSHKSRIRIPCHPVQTHIHMNKCESINGLPIEFSTKHPSQRQRERERER